jgi:hypothetical protein
MDVCVAQCCTVATEGKSQDNQDKEVRIKYKQKPKKKSV